MFVHMCEKKRRWQQEKEIWVQLGFNAFIKFYQLSLGKSIKTYADFVDSQYYTAFVKYGRYCQEIRCINFDSFTRWLIMGNKKLDQWCKDSFYSQWLIAYIPKEAVSDALERALKEMQDQSDEDPTILPIFSDYFRKVNPNRICMKISSGRISPWIVYNCQSGVEFLEKLNEDQLNLILPVIDPSTWDRKLRESFADVEWAKEILKISGM